MTIGEMDVIENLATEIAAAHAAGCASEGATWSRADARDFHQDDLEAALNGAGVASDESAIAALRLAIADSLAEIEHLPIDGGELLDALFGDGLNDAIADVRDGMSAARLVEAAARDAVREGATLIAGATRRAAARLEALAAAREPDETAHYRCMT